MWQMMHTLLAIILLIMRLRVYMQRRQHKHWQEHRQQHPRRIISFCRLFHSHICACKGSTNRVKNQKKSPFPLFFRDAAYLRVRFNVRISEDNTKEKLLFHFLFLFFTVHTQIPTILSANNQTLAEGLNPHPYISYRKSPTLWGFSV